VKSRLTSVDPELAARVASAKPADQRRVAIASAERAVESTGLSHAVITKALQYLRMGDVGDGPARNAVRELTQSLDEDQWALQEEVDAGNASASEHLAAFSRARAASAVEFAMAPNPREAALEALYETLAAIDDIAELQVLVAESING
jgi:hypothetical protein